jgi:hypothetical protein
MRRLLLTTLALAVMAAGLVPAAPAHAQSVDAGYYRFATAMWRPNGTTVFIADAFYLVDPVNGEVATAYVFVTRGRCQDQRNEHFVIVSCVAKGHGGEVPSEQFTMDDDLAAAHAEVRAGKYRHTIDWTGVGPEPEWRPFGGVTPFESTIGVNMARDAIARARLYGVKLRAKPDPYRFTMLAQELVAGHSLSGEMRERGITFAEDGSVEVHRAFSVPVRPQV